jgi:ribosomal RNA-processing protein 9
VQALKSAVTVMSWVYVQESRDAERRRGMRDDELSGEEWSDDDEVQGQKVQSESEDEDQFAEETVDETRLRLAKKYLETVKHETQTAEDEGDDAFTFNQDAIAHRLQQDVSEAKGRQYRRVADKVAAALPTAGEPRFLRGHKLAVTAVALSGDDSLCFSASKDGQVLQWDVESGAKSRIFPLEEKHGPTVHALAASQDGKFVAIGGKDCLVHVYDVRQRSIATSFKGHRDAVSCLAFRRGTHQLFSGSLDRTIKSWNLDEMCYVESLFGHQDQITGLCSLMRERCISSSRDRTNRLWKIVEESHLILRGHTASIDCVAMSTEDLYCSGSQDGGFSLWSVHKKKPTTMKKPAHGRDANGVANWVASCAAMAYTDLVASGSCDGAVKLWKCSNENATLEEVGQVALKGYVNALAFASSGRFLAAGVGQEHRLGRWKRLPDSKNGLALIPLVAGGEEE